MLYYKMLGKKIVLTAHNVNAGKRDANDSLLNRLTLGIQYRLADHIFVHTEQMKRELLDEFGVRERATTVIPFGINQSVPDTDLTPAQAKQRLGISAGERAILFFGMTNPWLRLRRTLRSAFGGRPTNPHALTPDHLDRELRAASLRVEDRRWILPGLADGLIVRVRW